MPALKTEKIAPPTPCVRFAKAIHDSHRARSFSFENTPSKSDLHTVLRIGRSGKCEIRIKNRATSRQHATLQLLPDDKVMLIDQGSKNGTFIDDEPISGPVVLQAGMKIQMGNAIFVAVDERGSCPIRADTVSEQCRTAFTLYGNCRIAGERVGRSREFVRVQHLPRSQRSKRRKLRRK